MISKMRKGTKFKLKKEAYQQRSPVAAGTRNYQNCLVNNSMPHKRTRRRPQEELQLLCVIFIVIILWLTSYISQVDCNCQGAELKEATGFSRDSLGHTSSQMESRGSLLLPDELSKKQFMGALLISDAQNKSELRLLRGVEEDGEGDSRLIQKRGPEPNVKLISLEDYGKKHLRRSKHLKKLLSRSGGFLSSFVPNTGPRILQQPNTLMGRNLRRLHQKLHQSNQLNPFNLNSSSYQDHSRLVVPRHQPKYLPLAQSAFNQRRLPGSMIPLQGNRMRPSSSQPMQQQLPFNGREQNNQAPHKPPRQVVLVHSLPPPPIQSSFSIESGEDFGGDDEEEGYGSNSDSEGEPDETEHSLAQVDNLIKGEFENRLNLHEQLANGDKTSSNLDKPYFVALSNLNQSIHLTGNENAQSAATTSTTSTPEELYIDPMQSTTHQSSWASDTQSSQSQSRPDIHQHQGPYLLKSMDSHAELSSSNNLLRVTTVESPSLRAQYTRDIPLTMRIGNSGATVAVTNVTMSPLLVGSAHNGLETIGILKPILDDSQESIVNQTQRGVLSSLRPFTIDNKSSLLRPTALTSFQRLANQQVSHPAPYYRHSGPLSGGDGMTERPTGVFPVAFPSTPALERQVRLPTSSHHPHPAANQQHPALRPANNTQPILVYDNESEQRQRARFRERINQSNNNNIIEPADSPVTALSQHEPLAARKSASQQTGANRTSNNSDLSETLKRLRETKAKIRQLQAEINATNPNLLLVNALVANNNSNNSGSLPDSSSSSSNQGEPKTTTDSLLSAVMSLLPSGIISAGGSNNTSSQSTAAGELFRFWPLTIGHSNGSVFLKGGTVVQAKDSLNLPIGMYHNGPLTAPGRLVASAFGRAAQSTISNHFPFAPNQWTLPRLNKNPMGLQVLQTPSSAPILVGSTLTVASNESPTTPLPPDDEKPVSSSTRRPYSWPLPEPLNKETSGKFMPPAAGVLPTKPSSQLRGSGGNPGAKLVPPSTMIVDVLTGTGQQPGTNQGGSSDISKQQWPTSTRRQQQKSDDKSSSTAPPTQRATATEWLDQQSSSSTWRPSMPVAVDSTFAREQFAGKSASKANQTKHQLMKHAPDSINAILNDVTRPDPDKRNADGANQPTGNFISHIFSRLADNLSGLAFISVPSVGAQNLTGEAESSSYSSNKLTTEKVLHALIYATCSAALLCLLVVSAVLYCGPRAPNRKIVSRAGGNPGGALGNFQSAGGLYQLDWRRFGLGGSSADANQHQHYNKLIHDGTMHNVSLLARHQTSNKPQIEPDLAGSAPLGNAPCCHCATCSGKSSKEQVSGKQSKGQCQQQQAALCYSGLYQQGPRGKLPFGAASSVNKFLNQFNRKSTTAFATAAEPGLLAKQQVGGRGPIAGTRLRMMSAIDERTSPSFAALPMTTGRSSEELNEGADAALHCTCNLHELQSQQQPREGSPSDSRYSATGYPSRYSQQQQQFRQTGEQVTEVKGFYEDKWSAGGMKRSGSCDLVELNNESANKRCNCDKSINLSACTNVTPCGLSESEKYRSRVISGKTLMMRQQQIAEASPSKQSGLAQPFKGKPQRDNCDSLHCRCKQSNGGCEQAFDSIRMEEQVATTTSAKDGAANCESVACGCCTLCAKYQVSGRAASHDKQLAMSNAVSASDAAPPPPPANSAKANLCSSSPADRRPSGAINPSLALQGSAQTGESRTAFMKQHRFSANQVADFSGGEETGSDLERAYQDGDQDGEEDASEREEEDLNDSGCCPHDIRDSEPSPESLSGEQVVPTKKAKRQRAAKLAILTSPLSLAATFRRKLRRTLIDVNERHHHHQQQQQQPRIDPLPVGLSPNRRQQTNSAGLHQEIHLDRRKPLESEKGPPSSSPAQRVQKTLVGCGQEQFKTCCDRFDSAKL